MKYNDISNHRSSVIGIKCEGTLLQLKTSFFDKIKNRVVGSFYNADIDKEVLSLMNYLYWDTEMTVMLFVDDNNMTNRNSSFLKDFPIGSIYNYKSINEITMMLNTGQLSYFVNCDKVELQNLNSRYAIDLETFNSMLKRNRKVDHLL